MKDDPEIAKLMISCFLLIRLWIEKRQSSAEKQAVLLHIIYTLQRFFLDYPSTKNFLKLIKKAQITSKDPSKNQDSSLNANEHENGLEINGCYSERIPMPAICYLN